MVCATATIATLLLPIGRSDALPLPLAGRGVPASRPLHPWMTPDQWLQLARDLGLPVAMLLGFGWLFLTGRIVTRRELDKWVALYERERDDRVTAQKMVAEFGSASAGVAEAVADLSRTVVSAKPDPYTERERGSRAR